MQEQVAGLRRFGAAALDLAWVAAGRLDGYWERDIKPWDMAAGLILVREAGGFVSDCDGGEDMFAKGQIAAGNDAIHKEMLAVLKAAGKERLKAAQTGPERPQFQLIPPLYPFVPAQCFFLVTGLCHIAASKSRVR